MSYVTLTPTQLPGNLIDFLTKCDPESKFVGSYFKALAESIFFDVHIPGPYDISIDFNGMSHYKVESLDGKFESCDSELSVDDFSDLFRVDVVAKTVSYRASWLMTRATEDDLHLPISLFPESMQAPFITARDILRETQFRHIELVFEMLVIPRLITGRTIDGLKREIWMQADHIPGPLVTKINMAFRDRGNDARFEYGIRTRPYTFWNVDHDYMTVCKSWPVLGYLATI